MELAVDLTINSTTGELGIELSIDGDRKVLESSQAAKLAADLATVLAFTVANGGVRTESEPVSVTTVSDEDSNRELDEDYTPPRIRWHRGTGRQTGQYVADLGEVGKGVIIPDQNKGWNVKIGGKKINSAPISKAAQAKELVYNVLAQRVGTTV
jgi:hypothetical protein